MPTQLHYLDFKYNPRTLTHNGLQASVDKTILTSSNKAKLRLYCDLQSEHMQPRS